MEEAGSGDGRADPAVAAFRALPPSWQAAFEEAWASWCQGSLGVGAVVTCEGRIVARGHNQMRHQGPGPLSETYLAHAEMNALAQVPTGRGPEYHIVSTFEPCLLCSVACRYYRVRQISYATPDPVWEGTREWLEGLRPKAMHTTSYDCLGGPLGAFGYVLHVSRLVGWAPDEVLDAHRQRAAPLFELSSRQDVRARLQASSDGAGAFVPVVAVMQSLWGDLTAAAGVTAGGGFDVPGVSARRAWSTARDRADRDQ